MMGADYYETDSEIASLLAKGKVPMGVGKNTKIRSNFACQMTPLAFHVSMPKSNTLNYAEKFIILIIILRCCILLIFTLTS